MSTASLMIICSFVIVLAALYARLIAFRNVRKVEMNSISNALELFSKDYKITSALVLIFLFAGMSFYIALQPTVELLQLWIVLLFVTLVILGVYVKWTLEYAMREVLLQKLVKRCLSSIKKGDQAAAFEILAILIESLAKAVDHNECVFGERITQQLLGIIAQFMKMQSKNSMQTREALLESVDHICVYLCHRFEWIFKIALDKKLDPLNETILSAFGKMSLILIQSHAHLVHVPLLALSRSAILAQSVGDEELNMRAMAVFSEVAKNLIMVSKNERLSLKEAILLVLSHLEQNTSATFTKNKEINPALLMQPFAEIGELLADSQYTDFPDRNEIFAELQKRLQSLSALDLVMQQKKGALNT